MSAVSTCLWFDTQAEDAARDSSMVLIFKRLPATRDSAEDGEQSYAELEDAATTGGKTNYDRLADLLLAACYVRADSVAGDLGLSWREASRPLDDRDLEQLRNMIVGHHRMGAAIPFDPRTSGQPETT